MPQLQLQRFGHEEWQPISRRDARKLILKEVCYSEEGATLLLDDLVGRRVDTVGLNTRGTLRAKPDGRKRSK